MDFDDSSSESECGDAARAGDDHAPPTPQQQPPLAQQWRTRLGNSANAFFSANAHAVVARRPADISVINVSENYDAHGCGGVVSGGVGQGHSGGEKDEEEDDNDDHDDDKYDREVLPEIEKNRHLSEVKDLDIIRVGTLNEEVSPQCLHST